MAATTVEQVRAEIAAARSEGRRADLRYADLYGAVMRYADLRDAVMRYADLYGAVMRYADLYGADLTGADLTDSQRDYAEDRGAIL